MPRGISKNPELTRQRKSAALSGEKNPFFGKKHSEHTKNKIREKLKGKKAPWVSESNKDREYSEDTRKKRSLVMKDNLKKLWSSEKHKERMAGENNPAWIKDRTKVKVSDNRRDDSKYKTWRQEVYKRDRWQCKIRNKECKGGIEAHHILTWKDHPELRYQINNGITLCHAHHPKRRSEEKRLSPYFKELLAR